MLKYNFLVNDYEITQNATEEAKKWIENRKGWELSFEPNFVFILGGDGTFLKAVRQYENNLDKVKFVPFKMGGIGYYTNHHFVHDFLSILENIEQNHIKTMAYELLNVVFNGKSHFALNEVKIVNEEHAIFTDLFIDDEFLEEYHGTGLVFSTATGTSGYMKSTGGALIYDITSGIFQMNEISPVSTNKFRTLNASMIFSKSNRVTLTGEIKKEAVIIDTKKYALNDNKVEISMAKQKVQVIVSEKTPSRLSILRDLFIIDRQKQK